MFKVRKFKVWYYVLLVVVFALALWLNSIYLQMETIVCTSADGVCSQIQSYVNYEYLAFGSIAVFAIMVIYMYLFNLRKSGNSELEDIDSGINETSKNRHDEIDFNQESARTYTKSYLDSGSAK